VEEKEKKHLIRNVGAIALMIGLTLMIVFCFRYYNTSINITAADIREFTSKKDNAQCLKCHSRSSCEIPGSKNISKNKIYSIRPQNRIDTVRYYNSNHWDFKCTDCHSDEYLNVPHDSSLKENAMITCLDCHGGDETFAHFHFEDIDTACMHSVHYMTDSINFSCWNCHIAHYDKLHSRDTIQPLRRVISYDNMMCLTCHSKEPSYRGTFRTGNIKTDMATIHAWLPETELHMNNVRCIDCHAASNDNMMVSHRIEPKTLALKDCKACHSENSVLLNTLYKNRKQAGLKKISILKDLSLDGKPVSKKMDDPVLNTVLIALTAIILFIILFYVIRHMITIVEKK